MPQPFVAPNLETTEGSFANLGEVVLIRASAAVGKSTIAKALSARRGLPILDLARTPVSTGSLKALLLDLKNGTDPVDAFHAGELPVIIDALDEGRLLSNDNGFFSFLETSAELLCEDRSETSRPKLILLGRYDAIDYAKLALNVGNVSFTTLEVGFFSKSGAEELILAYAASSADEDSAFHTHTEPVHRLIEAYFNKIESALGLVTGTLWDDEKGRNFAGYAPVLAAIGSLLPEIENYAEALVKINEPGARDAWSVIEAVLEQIILRERGKLLDQLSAQVSSSLPDEVYDLEEQLSLLLQFVQRQALNGAGRVHLSTRDSAKYAELVTQWIAEHPFIRDGHFTNDVLAAFVLSHAIILDRELTDESATLAYLSRQPFLWRSIAGRLKAETLLDGKYLGCILGSFWNDPLTIDGNVVIWTSDDEAAAIVLLHSSGGVDHRFLVTSPIVFLSQMRNVEIDFDGEIICSGIGDGGSSAFFFRGVNSLYVGSLLFVTKQIDVSGRLVMDCGVLSAPQQLNLRVDESASVGWGESLRDRFPWNRHPANIEIVSFSTTGRLQDLLDECARRFHTGAALALNADFSPPERDTYTQWARRKYGQDFATLVSILVDFDLAVSEPLPASGTGKIRVRLKVAWDVLEEAYHNACAEPTLSECIAALKAAIP